MIKIYSTELSTQLHNKGLCACYFLIGNEPLLLNESADAILSVALDNSFEEHLSITLDTQTDWDSLFASCQLLNLFTQRKTLTLFFPEHGPNAAMSKQLVKLSTLLHPDIILICRITRLTKVQEKSVWFKALTSSAMLVRCQTPEEMQLPSWILRRAKILQLTIDDPSIQLLCYYYEGNMLALSQTLERLALQWPDGKLTLPRVEVAVSDLAHFTASQWVDALLAGRSQRALHILRQMEKEENEVVILLRTLQRDLITLLYLQRYQSKKSLHAIMDQQGILQNRRSFFMEALTRLEAHRLKRAIHLLAQIEVMLKQDYGQPIWLQLQTLSLLIANRNFPTNFIHV